MNSLRHTEGIDQEGIDRVLDSRQYDKLPYKRLKNFTYYEYKGVTRSLNGIYDLRNGMIYGLCLDKIGILIHVPQYKNVVKGSVKAVNRFLSKSVLEYGSYYREV